jgi:hypothetical protein
MSNELFNAGLAFRQAVQSRQIHPHQFGALLQDICTDQPALLDLSARQDFRGLRRIRAPGIDFVKLIKS